MDVKHGVLTSEFLLGILAVVAPPLLQFLQAAPNPVVSVAGMVLAAIYAALRTQLKIEALPPAPVAPAAAPAAPVAPQPAPAPKA